MINSQLDRMAEEGLVELDEERKATMGGNLLVVLCGERAAQPMTSCAAATPRSNFCCARR